MSADYRIEAAAAAIANARGARKGVPKIANILAVLKEGRRTQAIHDEVMEDAAAALAAADRARETRAEADVARIAAGLLEPARLQEINRHHRALLAALNQSYTPPAAPGGRGTQDALTVFEAIAMLLGQMIGNSNADEAHGTLEYLRRRALRYAPAAVAEGVAADHAYEPGATG